MLNKKSLLVLCCACLGCLIAACDPMLPDATPRVIVITQIVTQVPAPTLIPTTIGASTPSDAPTGSDGSPVSITPAAVPGTPAGTASATVIGNIANSGNAVGTASAACGETKGQVLDLTFDSKVESSPVAYRVYLPPCYNATQRRYPYVILMPGSDKDQTEWTSILKADAALDAGIAVQALPPMILVMPNGGDLMNNNIFQDGASWESVIVGELIPEVEKNFCTWNERQGRAIGGISRGGFWAFEIAFRHLDLFSAVGGHSPYFDPENAGPDYNPLGLAKTVQFAPGAQPRIWLDVAQDDDVRANVEILERTLSGRNIDPGYTMNSTGGHDTDYWGSHVAEYLAFYGQKWPHNPLDLPSCLQ